MNSLYICNVVKSMIYLCLIIFLSSCAATSGSQLASDPLTEHLSPAVKAKAEAWRLAGTGLDTMRDAATSGQQSKEVRLAIKLFDDMRMMADAIEQFRVTKGITPRSYPDLVKEGFLGSLPTMGYDLGNGRYEFVPGYDDLDGNGIADDVIYTARLVAGDVCREYNRLFAEAPLKDGTVFDYEAAGNSYPAKFYGNQFRTYAIKWHTKDTKCEFNWVLDYNE